MGFIAAMSRKGGGGGEGWRRVRKEEESGRVEEFEI